MLRTTLFSVVLAVSTLFSLVTFAANLLPSPTKQQLVTKVMKIAKAQYWLVNIDQVKAAIESGPNYAAKYVLIAVACGIECQTGVAINIDTGTIIELPTAEYGYYFRKDYSLLVVNPDPSEWLPDSDLTGTGKLPDWLFRKMYTIKKGQFVKFYEDKAGPGAITTDQAFYDYSIIPPNAD